MYLQIMEQIKQKVRAGDWPAGHPLPSIRELSVVTKVSVITVKRAYTELEKTLDNFIRCMKRLGLSDTEILAQVKKALGKVR